MRKFLLAFMAAFTLTVILIAQPANAAPIICEGRSSCNATQVTNNLAYIQGTAFWCFYTNNTQDVLNGPAFTLRNLTGSTHVFEIQLRREEPTNSLIRQTFVQLGPNEYWDWYPSPGVTAAGNSEYWYFYIEGQWGIFPEWRLAWHHLNGPAPWLNTIDESYTLGTLGSCSG